jgi:uncharacterized protein (DUF433 family)
VTITDSITHHIEEDAEHRGPARARLRDSGVEVWVLVAQLPAMDGDPVRLAEAYSVPVEAVEAALAYYRRHRKVIDAQIAVNAA